MLLVSHDQSTTLCSHFPECGGCTIQHLPYHEQLGKKEEIVRAFFPENTIDPIIGCQNPWQYRNKMEFSFSQDRQGKRFLGLMKRKGKVIDLQECFLVSPWFMQALDRVRNFWQENSLLAYHPRKNKGHLRTLILREAKRTKSKLIMLTVSGDPSYAIKEKEIAAFVQAAKQSVSQEDLAYLSIFLRIQQAIKGVPTQFFEIHLHGPDHLREVLEIEGRKLLFKISPTSFFQTNSIQAEILYAKAIDLLEGIEDATILDLYSGIGSFTLALATRAKQVIGIEINPYAVFDAEWNKEENKLNNAFFYQGEVSKILKEISCKPEIIVVDPPRSGLDPVSMKEITNLHPKQILYISCNPKTQAENIQFFQNQGYFLKKIQPIDQFPHTNHIENIVLLSKKN
ncbi:MAG: 23S rRNA (uracil(1939)-C(5))-methyltransferase RlmD [Chlamydiae bacterium]|nr:23S rRNA (uracil(1939)-C(5))-methyltransferase RlmD [Chlamydiota bacterium]